MWLMNSELFVLSLFPTFRRTVKRFSVIFGSRVGPIDGRTELAGEIVDDNDG